MRSLNSSFNYSDMYKKKGESELIAIPLASEKTMMAKNRPLHQAKDHMSDLCIMHSHLCVLFQLPVDRELVPVLSHFSPVVLNFYLHNLYSRASLLVLHLVIMVSSLYVFTLFRILSFFRTVFAILRGLFTMPCFQLLPLNRPHAIKSGRSGFASGHHRAHLSCMTVCVSADCDRRLHFCHRSLLLSAHTIRCRKTS